MDLNNLDKKIKSSLENMEVPFDQASWFALENKMNATVTEEQPAAVDPVDLVVKRTFDKMELPYEPAHWNLLNARLNNRMLINRIRVTKLAEVAIFLLLIANVEGFLGGFNEIVKPTRQKAPVVSQPMANAQKSKKLKHRNAASEQPFSPVSSLIESVSALISENLTPVESQNLSSNLSSPQNTTELAASSSILDGSRFYTKSGILNFNDLQRLPQSKTVDFAWKEYLESIPGVPDIDPVRSPNMYISSYASLEKNQFSSAGFSQKQNGFGGGIAVGKRFGKNGIETGIAYSSKSFSPKKEVDIYAGNAITGFFGAYVNEVSADVFSIPVKVTHQFAKLGKARAHVTAGLTAHVATQKQFAYKSLYSPPASPDPVPVPSPDQYPAVPRKNHQGAFEKGSLKSNSFATLDLGLRVEYPIGKKHVAFVEPSYHQSLGGGFGPKKEKVNVMAFQAGVMAAL